MEMPLVSTGVVVQILFLIRLHQLVAEEVPCNMEVFVMGQEAREVLVVAEEVDRVQEVLVLLVKGTMVVLVLAVVVEAAVLRQQERVLPVAVLVEQGHPLLFLLPLLLMLVVAVVISALVVWVAVEPEGPQMLRAVTEQ